MKKLVLIFIGFSMTLFAIDPFVDLPELDQIYYTVEKDYENDIELKFLHKYHNEEIRSEWFPVSINQVFEWVENGELFLYRLN